jgi:hypothetical protein
MHMPCDSILHVAPSFDAQAVEARLLETARREARRVGQAPVAPPLVCVRVCVCVCVCVDIFILFIFTPAPGAGGSSYLFSPRRLGRAAALTYFHPGAWGGRSRPWFPATHTHTHHLPPPPLGAAGAWDVSCMRI